ncbi:CAP domain-containing protein [Jiangella gansuensis]|uniref:CAP domain-containing protein n=1 Tax=Jiangella gansuensis TaxID=281473 RepID=UPI000478D933|nr:CAP domain-containing protein [Jiangella gansuensis]
MTSNHRHARLRRLPPFVKVGAIAVLPVLGVGGLIYAVTDDEPVLHARVESTTPDFTERDDDSETPSPQASTPAETPSMSPTGTPSPTDDASGEAESDSGSGGSSDGSSGSGSDSDDETPDADEPSERPLATLPPTQPMPTDEPTPTPTDDAEPTDEPTPTPSDEAEPTDEPTPDEPDPEPTQPVLPELPLSGPEAGLLEAVAEVRADAGCPDLRLDARLQTAAREHSVDMRQRHFVSNVNPDGEGPEDRAADQGYHASVGENVNFGQRRPSRVVAAWSDQRQERAQMLDCDYTAVGVGVESGLFGSWWTLTLGRD